MSLHTVYAQPQTPRSVQPPEEHFNVDLEQISRLKLNSVIAVMGLKLRRGLLKVKLIAVFFNYLSVFIQAVSFFLSAPISLQDVQVLIQMANFANYV